MRAICASRGRVVSTAGAWPRTSSSSEMWRARSRRWPLRWQLCRRAARRADRGAATLRPGRARERLSWIARHTWHRPLPRVGRHVRARAAAKKAIPRVIPASTHELKDGPCTNASQQADSRVTCCPTRRAAAAPPRRRRRAARRPKTWRGPRGRYWSCGTACAPTSPARQSRPRGWTSCCARCAWCRLKREAPRPPLRRCPPVRTAKRAGMQQCSVCGRAHAAHGHAGSAPELPPAASNL